MTEIQLYAPGGQVVTLQFPTTWDELTLQELELFSKISLTSFSHDAGAKTSFLKQLLASRAQEQNLKLPKGFEERLDPEDIGMSGITLVGFLFEENTLENQPYPFITLAGQRLTGPASGFNDLTCGEFEDAEVFFHKFVEQPGPEHLARMAAILYRPGRSLYIGFSPNGGRRSTYDSDCMYRAFLNWPVWKLYTIFTWYAGCRSWLPKYFPTVFDGGSDGEPDMTSFTKCIHHGAGPKNGTRDQIRGYLVKEFFFDMELTAKAHKEQMEAYERAK